MNRALLNSRSKPTRLPPEYQERLAWMPAHRIFEDTVAQWPDAIAIQSGDRQYTYREANERAERIARDCPSSLLIVRKHTAGKPPPVTMRTQTLGETVTESVSR